jgi:hypothetical protein
MPKKPSKPKLRKDAAETAWAVVQAAIGEGPRPEPPGKREKYPEAVERGAKGGKTRAAKLSKRAKKTSAKKAAQARWKKV